ncbi:hypothetical protein AB1L42_15390 [Thalassoglobus sp. JC818]|uniref:hypothetical protein n=1 Tax=Thalassoglobus sp. JC818 TaxID=3232136 RepID=UPI003458B016
MPGFQELIIKLSPIIIGVGIVLAGVTRLRKKLSTEAQSTLGTYINELGGYVIAAIIALILGIYLLFFDQGSTPDSTGSSPGDSYGQQPVVQVQEEVPGAFKLSLIQSRFATRTMDVARLKGVTADAK